MNFKPHNTSHAKGGARVIVVSMLVLAGLLVLPVLAVCRRHLDFRWVGACVLLINAFTYWAYAKDKRQAQAGEWRISERILHLAELLGGWPAALIAQRRLRHKCSKGSYQFVFWLIVMAYQFAAYDSLQSWRFTSGAWNYLEQHPKHGRNSALDTRKDMQVETTAESGNLDPTILLSSLGYDPTGDRAFIRLHLIPARREGELQSC